MGGFPASQEAFHRHRHDVMNGLQLVKAYLQLHKPVEAMAAVDRLALWLHSLSELQAHLHEENLNLLWTAAQCPRVLIHSLDVLDLSDAVQLELSACLLWLEEQANEQGIHVMKIQLLGRQSLHGCTDEVEVLVHIVATEETAAWWHNITDDGTNLHTWSHVQLRCDRT